MCDRRAERAPLRGHVRVDVDPLVVTGRLREQVDVALLDRVPLAGAELALA